jgi:murein DD-endopeptidase MepM/ murein hydrolase activator NlpD
VDLFQDGQQGFGADHHGQGGGAGALTLTRPARLGAIARVGQGVGDRLAATDLVVDLGARIGSREWWRGLATCTALCVAAGSLTPSFKPVVLSPEAPLGQAQWEESRALAIAPLGLGADTGRRLAANDQVERLADTPERPRIDLTATIGQGDGFARVLERAGVAKSEAGSIASMVAAAVPLSELDAGTRMDLVLGRRERKSDPRPLESLGFRAKFDLKLAIARVDGALRLQRIPIAVDNTPLRIQGRVGSSLYSAARAAGVPGDAIQAFLRAITRTLSIRQISSDARFDAIIAHRRAETGEVEMGQLLYAGITQGNRKTQMLKWTVGGQDKWFEANGVGETKGVMSRPVMGHLTSSFGMRFHPVLGFSRMHQGLDFGAPFGSPIVAATDGNVIFAGPHGGHGNYVRIGHAGNIQTGYAHMSRIVARAGEHVRQGQLIGYVGSTGLSTGPHLHYEVFQGGRPINPASMKFTTTEQLAGAELSRFKAKLANLLAVRVASTAAPDPKAEKRAETAAPAKKDKRG